MLERFSQQGWALLTRLMALSLLLLGAAVLFGCAERRQPSPPLEAHSSEVNPPENAALDVAEAAPTPRTEHPVQTTAPPASAEPTVSPKPGSTSEASAEVAVPPASQGKSAVVDGKELYARHCAACHGAAGDGQGIAAAWLFPKPRDFRMGKFRLASTINGAPTRNDLHSVLVRGMPGSSMPPWPQLSQGEREALVDEVLRLYREGIGRIYLTSLQEQEGLTEEELEDPEIQQEVQEFVERRTTPGAESEVPEIGEPTPEAIAQGKDLYVKQGCAACHGSDGKGDGQQKMVDDEGLPTRPRDFTRGIFKGGHDVASLYRRIAYGMPGTPMPSSSKMTPQEMIDVTHFVRSLSDESTRQNAILNRERLKAKSVATTPKTAEDPLWASVDPMALRMVPLWWRDNSDPQLQVQAVHDGQTLALLISWRDETQDPHEITTSAFEDGVAVELFAGAAEPFFGMGLADSPVDVWLWSAGREAPRPVEAEYPRMVVDVYPFHEGVVASPEFQRDAARDEQQPDISLPARASGNQISTIADNSAATTHAAASPGSLSFRMPHSQLVKGHGRWNDGRWTVVLHRVLSVDDPADGVALKPGRKASIAFAIWDGNQNDRGSKKQVTIWQDLELE